MKYIDDLEYSDEVTDCPNCGKEYDEIDAEYLICHYCGYNAETNKFKSVKANISRYGIDPDVKLDDWS